VIRRSPLVITLVLSALTGALVPPVRGESESEKVLADTSLTFHWTPGAWFMLLRVDCNRQLGMEAEVTDPSGKVLCPLKAGSTWATQVANRCDCFAFNHGPIEGGGGFAFVSASLWKPSRAPYRIRVRCDATCEIRVSVGAQFSRTPHWGEADTLTIGPGDERVWTARWGNILHGDSSRVSLQRERR